MIKNCTPHPIVVRVNGIETVFQPSGIIPRVGTIETPAAEVEGIPCVAQVMGQVEGLPSLEPGVFLLVSALVFGACGRTDLLAPDTGKGAIRDEQGRILAVTRMIRRGK